MAVKCTGAEFKRFYADSKYWIGPEQSKEDHTWHDDGLFYVNDVEQPEGIDTDQLLDTDTVKIEGGVVFGEVVGPKEPSLESYFKRWKKEQTTTAFLVECDIAMVEAVKKAVIAAGGKVQ